MKEWRKSISSELLGLTIFMFLVLASCLGLYMRLGPENATPGMLIGVLAALVCAVIAMFFFWKRIDEAAREAHKTAWWWGGQAGFVVFCILLVAGFGPAIIDSTTGKLPFNTPYLATALAAFIAQSIGYAVHWAAWWLQKR